MSLVETELTEEELEKARYFVAYKYYVSIVERSGIRRLISKIERVQDENPNALEMDKKNLQAMVDVLYDLKQLTVAVKPKVMT